MRTLFRNEDSPRRRAFAVVHGLFLAITIYGGLEFKNFKASAPVTQWAVWIALPIAVALAFGLIADKNPANKINAMGPLRQLLAAGLIFAFYTMLCWLSCASSIPTIITKLAGQDRVEQVRILSKRPYHTGRGCHYRIQIGTPALDAVSDPCVDEAQWRRSSEGATFQASFKIGPLGVLFVELLFESDGSATPAAHRPSTKAPA